MAENSISVRADLSIEVANLIVCPPVLSSISDRVPEMDENWTFYTCSGLYAKKGALDRFLY
jgi:hypothetical protein